jgi:hypothetical protein
MNDRIALLGADLAPTALQAVEAGLWRFAYGAGALRHIHAGGAEVLRAVEFVVRDADWGAPAPGLSGETLEQTADGLRMTWNAVLGPADAPILRWRGVIEARGDTLDCTVEGAAERDFLTARTGFVTLHPIDGFAGVGIDARGPDGATRRVAMPRLVSPAQPLKDIAALTVPLPDGALHIAYEADQPFEMEDQRNWTDASFKTYYRPLALPRPYRLAAGEVFRQAVRLRLTRDAPRTAQTPAPRPAAVAAQAPRRTLVWFADEAPPADAEALAALRPDRLDAQIDLRAGDPGAQAAQAQALARRLGCALGLRLILPDAGDPAPALAAAAAASGPVAAAIALPAAWLDSHQPEGPWPQGLSCAQALAALRAAFPQAEAAEGALTFFPELNRHPPRAGGDAVSFGTAAIVHAVDDISAMETLEALPDVFATAAGHAAGRPVDVGLAALALWRNPYGAGLVDNRDWRRVAMSGRDPRIRGLFGAAWLTACMAQAAAAGVRSVGVGAVSGPLGLIPGPEDDAAWTAAFPGARARPPALAMAALAALGPRLRVTPPARRGDLAILSDGALALAANTAPSPAAATLRGARAARVLDAAALPAALRDPLWLTGPPQPLTGQLALPPYAVALIHLETT